MNQDEDFSIKYVSPGIVCCDNDFAFIYREGDLELRLFVKTTPTSSGLQYDLELPPIFFERQSPKALSGRGRQILSRLRHFIDNEVWDFQTFGVPKIFLDGDYELPGWVSRDGNFLG